MEPQATHLQVVEAAVVVEITHINMEITTVLAVMAVQEFAL